MSKPISIPVIHRNGTSGEVLLETTTDACEAIRDAMDKLRKTAPNARDYYTRGPSAFKFARAEYEARASKLNDVLTELESLALGISNATDERKVRNES